jgi:hypothetical protein
MIRVMVESQSSIREYVKFSSLIVVIILVSLFLKLRYGHDGYIDYLRWFMGIFFVVFALFKLVGYRMFTLMFSGYDIIARRFKPYSYAYPFIELLLGILYLTNQGARTLDTVTILVMGAGSIGVFQEIGRRSGIHCACLGNIIKLPLSTVSFVEDVGMGLMAIAMLIH